MTTLHTESNNSNGFIFIVETIIKDIAQDV